MSNVGRYSKVSRRIHVDEKVGRLSRPAPNGFDCFWYLLTAKESSNVPGLFQAYDVTLARSLRWPLEGFREAFAEVFREGLGEADFDAGLVWIPNAIKHNEPESPNVVVSWAVTLADLPDCALKAKAFAHLKAWAKAKGKAWAEAWAKACPNQEQEQEQIQEQSERDAPAESEDPMCPDPKPEHRVKISTGARRFAESFETEAPDQIEFTAEHRAFEANGINLQQTWLECRDHRRARRDRREDWSAEFLSWLRREAKFKRDGRSRPAGVKAPRQPNGGGFGAEFCAAAAEGRRQ